MSELLFFVLGLIIGVLSGVTFLCMSLISKNNNIEYPFIKNGKK